MAVVIKNDARAVQRLSFEHAKMGGQLESADIVADAATKTSCNTLTASAQRR